MRAVVPDVVESTPTPGMKLSWPSPVVPIGMRTGAVHVAPVLEVLITMSLPGQPARNRQLCQTTKTLPAPSISADGRGPLRRPPAGVCAVVDATVTGAFQVAPPSAERHAMTDDSSALSPGTITVPLGCTTGWPPMPVALVAVERGRPQVRPPSVD